MKNLVSTEKMLKHWLKKRVTITTATVVGFLLMGTAAFGEGPKVEGNKVTFEKGKTYDTGVEYNSRDNSPIIYVENNGTINITEAEKLKDKNAIRLQEEGEGSRKELINNGDIIVELGKNENEDRKDISGVKLLGNANIKNIGKITVSSNNGAVKGIEAVLTDKYVENIPVVDNTGVIKVSSKNEGANAVLVKNGGTISNNKGAIIEAESKEKYAGGINIIAREKNETKIINNGTIKVLGKTLATGIHLGVDGSYSGTTENMVENNGEIIASSDQYASAITVTNDSDKKISIKNGKDGILNVDGKGDHKTGAVRLDSTKGEVAFTNDGTIKIKDGTAISIKGENVKAEIGGNIEVSGDSVVVKNTDGTAEVTGNIILTDKTQQDITQTDIDSLFIGEVKVTGIIVDKDNTHYETSDIVRLEKGTTDDINTLGKDSQSVTMGNKNVTIDKNEGRVDTITAGKEAANIKSLNIVGDVKVGEFKNNSKLDKKETIELAVKDLNLDANGKLHVAQEDTLKITGSNVNKLENLKEKSKEAIVLRDKSNLILDGANINGADITGLASSTITTLGNTSFNGTIKNVGTINVKEGNLLLSADSKYEKVSKVNNKAEMTIDGNVNLAVGAEKNKAGEYTQNFFHNSNGLVNATGNGSITVVTENINGKKAVINLGENNTFDKNLEGKFAGNSIYEVKDENGLTDGKIEIAYKSGIFGNSMLDAVNDQAYEVSSLFSQDTVERKAQMDKIYSSNIYSETVKAAYDNVKMNEEAVESLARKSEIGKWTAEGKALYSKNEYDRKGIVGDYSSEVESTGLMAAYGYGLNETTTAGIAFSGVKQDVDTATGSADADLFYLGVYGNKVVGNYDFTAGLGYQFGKYEADNNILAGTGDKYDSQTVSGYVQGRYTADLGDGLSVQPKVKLGYTYVKQDDAKDSYFGVEDAEVSTFDAEAGFDVVKSFQLEKSKVDVKFGASYIRTMGDTDEEFTGRFYGAKASEGFNVLGAELAENVVKFNLGAEVTNENGFFYNGGFTYEFGSNDTEAYGVNVGAGYKF